MHATPLDSPMWLLETKLHPPMPRSDTLARPRLLHALRTGVQGSLLTLISAPAGYGKSTLLAALPTLLPDYPIAWVSLDTEENDPVRFLSTLLTVLQRIHPNLGSSAWPWLRGATGDHVDTARRVIGALINDFVHQVRSPVVLALDDLHAITEPSVYMALTYLIEHQPPLMRLVISTRHDPPLPLARLAARRQLAEIRRPDLRFTPDESEALLNHSLGLTLPASDLAALQERTEGWAVGLCLLASSLDLLAFPAQRSELLAGVKRAERYVFDFLADEVLRTLPPDVRRFLLQTSVLAELTPAACQAVTGRADAPELLASLYGKNLFLTCTGENTYCYHALFAEFLRDQLELTMADEVAQLHRRAALAQVAPHRAVSHYLAAGLWTEAANAIADVGEHLLLTGLVETIQGWTKMLPAAVRDQHPRLGYLLGRAAIKRGDYAEARLLLRQAQSGFASAGDRVAEQAALSALASCAALRGDLDELRTLVAASSPAGLPDSLRARALPAHYYVAMCDGRWEAAAHFLHEAIHLTLRLDDPDAVLLLSQRIGALFVMLPDTLPLAEAFAQRAAGIAAPDTPLHLANTDLLVFLHLLRGRLDDALAAAQSVQSVQERLGGYAWLGLHAALYGAAIRIARGEQALVDLDTILARVERTVGQHQLWLYLAGRTAWFLGSYGAAERLLSRMREPSMAELLPVPVLQHRLSGLLALSAGRYQEAQSELERAVALEQEAPISLAAGSARVLLARLQLQRGRPDEALGTLRPALAAAEAQGMPGLILQEGILVLPVLRLASKARGPGRTMATHLLGLLGDAVDATPPGEVGAILTQREIDVLRLMAGGATNRAIGQALYIGEETVKSHVTRLLRKLDATTRTEAAARGRELGLI